MNNTLTALKGVKVGHSTHPDKYTGCTVIIFDKNYPVSYVSSGGAPGTIATENLNNTKEFGGRDGLFIAGGSMNGLLSAQSIIRELIKQERGLKVGPTYLPVVSGAIVWDFSMGRSQYDPEYGAEALANISEEPVQVGNVGAGTGTAVGQFQRLEQGKKDGGMKVGVGSAKAVLKNGVTICALTVVNALGNVVDRDGKIIAGNRDENKDFKTFADTTDFVTNKSNTTITVVGINVDLKHRENYERVAKMAAQGQVRAINPVNTSIDGDTLFVFSNKEIEKPLNEMGKFFETEDWPSFSVDVIGAAAAEVVQDSIIDAARQAETIQLDDGYDGVIPSAKDYPSSSE